MCKETWSHVCSRRLVNAYYVRIRAFVQIHYCNDVIMRAMASQITGVSIVCSGADKKNHHSSASLAVVWGIHRWPVNSPHKGPARGKMFPFDDAIMTHVHTWIRIHYVWYLTKTYALAYQQIRAGADVAGYSLPILGIVSNFLHL